jgi:hypothetical protein
MYFWWVFLLGFLSLLWFLFNPSARSRSGASKARIAVMGGKLSQESRSSLPRLSSGNHYVIEDDQQYRQQSPLPPPPAASSSYSQAPSGYSHAPPPRSSGKRLSRKYSLITDQFTNVEQVQQALGQAGLESSNLIVGIDFTKSNEWTGVTHFLYTSLILL